NETFVLPIDVNGGARPAASRRLAERGRFSWSPDGGQLLFSKASRLMALPADGAGEAKPWRDEPMPAGAGDPVWSPDGSRFATLVVDPSVTDPELEQIRPGMYTIAQPFNDVYIVEADGSAKNLTGAFDDQVTDPVWSPDGGALFFRAVNNTAYDETLYRYTVRDQKLEPIARGQESYGRVTAIVGGIVSTAEDATHPAALWLIGAGRSRSRI